MSRFFESFHRHKTPIVALTAYSHPFAKLLDDCGIDLLLVGDSLGMVEHGHPDTTFVTMEEMILHTRCVRRGVRNTPVAADLPFGSYDSQKDALENSLRLRDAGAELVKLEGGREVAEIAAVLVQRDIPVLGHIGMLPQRIREEGRYRIKGKTTEEADALLADALALEQAGVSAIILELVEPLLAARISDQLATPTIGIGSGDGCDGQILVTYDLIGLTPWFKPRFVQPLANIGEIIQDAVKKFSAGVRKTSN